MCQVFKNRADSLVCMLVFSESPPSVTPADLFPCPIYFPSSRLIDTGKHSQASLLGVNNMYYTENHFFYLGANVKATSLPDRLIEIPI